MRFEVPWRKVATGGGVLLLHLLIVLLLLTTTGLVPLSNLGAPREIMLTLAPPPQPKRQVVPQPVIQEQVPVPSVELPSLLPHAITAPPPLEKPQSEGDIHSLGRYLFNCSGEYYEQLSPAEKEHCLRNHWTGPKPAEQQPVLGAAKPSPYDEIIKERNAPFQSPFVPCDPASLNASLHNVPCTNFQNGHSILQEVPGH